MKNNKNSYEHVKNTGNGYIKSEASIDYTTTSSVINLANEMKLHQRQMFTTNS